MDVRVTNRGFRRAEFIDLYESPCSIQESSSGTESCIWLGVNESRMHLTQEMVAELLPLLQYFVETGELPADDGNLGLGGA